MHDASKIAQIAKKYVYQAPGVYADQPTAATWSRIAAVGANAGRVNVVYDRAMRNLDVTPDGDDLEIVLTALADVIIAAEVAIQHLTGDIEKTVSVVDQRIDFAWEQLIGRDH
jgi:hypothetical protein